MAVFTAYGTFAWNTAGVTVGGIKPLNELADWTLAVHASSPYDDTYTVRGLDGRTYIEKVTYHLPAFAKPTFDLRFSTDGNTIGTVVGIAFSKADVGNVPSKAFLEQVLAGDDVIYGGEVADVLYGFAGGDAIYGNGGDDILSGGAGSDSMYGGFGIDTVVYPYDLGDYLVSRVPSNGSFSVHSKQGTLEYVHWDVEKFQFRDSTVDAASLPYYGVSSPVSEVAVQPVYRFFNTRDMAFFYTDSQFERDMVVDRSDPSRDNVAEWPYVFQGASFEAAHSHAGAVAIERFYNTRTGHHFFTVSQSEAEMVKAKIAESEWPFIYEGKAFAVYPSDPMPTGQGQEIPVHRFYSPTLDRHWFTSNQDEVDQIRLTGVWNDEGVAFWGEVTG